MSRSEPQKLKRRFAALGYHQQVTIATRLGLMPANAPLDNPVLSGMRIAQAFDNAHAWGQVEEMLARAETGTPI